MNEIQLRVSVARAEQMADAIERDIGAAPPKRDTTELASILSWLRYRVAKARMTTPTAPTR